MTLKRLHPGKRMSQGVSRGDIVYLAGQVAETKAGGPVAEQTREILGQIDKLLAEAGTDKTKIMMATIYLADIKTFSEMNSAWDAWVAEGATPARATVEAKLVAPEYKVEIAVVASI
jgi:enamine deaminase RidA (YjgF/YER057c/UK114 family)